MITLLARLFIRTKTDSGEASPSALRRAYGVLCGWVGICLNVLLFLGKLAAGLISGSISITADAFNNLSDAGSSLITLIGFRMAGQRPDRDHPFGHGRVEYLSGLFVAILILFMGLELLKSSFEKILHPQEPLFTPLIAGILLFSIAVKCYMAYYNKKIGAQLDSAAMRATALDSLSDALATSLVLASALISHFTHLAVDGWCGVLVGLFILWAGFQAARDTVNPLLGQAPDPAFVEKIQSLALSYDNVLGIHDVIVHNYGPERTLVSFHAEMPAQGDLLTLHDTVDRIEHRLRRELGCSAVIHMDPVCQGDEKTQSLRSLTLKVLASLDGRFTVHDFQAAGREGEMRLTFDVGVPYDCPAADEEIASQIERALRREDPSLTAEIQIDRMGG